MPASMFPDNNNSDNKVNHNNMIIRYSLPQVLVEKLRWMTPTIFLELLALCQVMPGPTSTQMSFAIGITQQGVTGGLLSGK